MLIYIYYYKQNRMQKKILLIYLKRVKKKNVLFKCIIIDHKIELLNDYWV